MSLIEALQDVRAELLAGQPWDEVLTATAQEYSLNPALVERKYRESYGDPAGVATRAAEAQAAEATRKRAKALEVCRSVAILYKDGLRWPYLGRTFTWEGETYMLAILDGGRPRWAVRTVRLFDAKPIDFNRRLWAQIKGSLHE